MAQDHQSFDLTTPAGLLGYLGRQLGNNDPTVQCLSGGTANYLYRATDKNTNSTSVYKHASPYLSSNPNFAFPQTRMDYEATILRQVLQFEEPASTTKAVGLLHYDPDVKLLHIEDGGARNLKTAYDDPELDVEVVAQNLAKWLANLHLRSTSFFLALSPDDPGKNNPIAVAIYRHSYANLHTALSKYGFDTSLAHRVNTEYGSLLETDDECVCHGDFWPGNVLVNTTTATTKSLHLTIVDWEMCRRGTSATDVGQFCAEAWLLDRFKGARDLRKSFLDAYLHARLDGKIGREWLRRVAVHWGTHVAYWPTQVEWTDREGTREVVAIGLGVLNNALDGDWEGLAESCLFGDVDVQEALKRP